MLEDGTIDCLYASSGMDYQERSSNLTIFFFKILSFSIEVVGSYR